MSKILKTEAVVLKSIDFKETSKIVTFYTKQFGKLVGMVKGARRTKSKYYASTQPMSYVSIVLYKKERREVQAISECDLVKSFRNLYDDMDKMSVGILIIELVNLATSENIENKELFSLLVNSLNTLNDAKLPPLNILYYFEIHLARTLGFQPVVNNCVLCKKELKRIDDNAVYRFSIEKGGLICARCSKKIPRQIILPANLLEILQKILSSNQIEFIINLNINQESRKALENFIWAYLRYHVQGLHYLKSRTVFSQILN